MKEDKSFAVHALEAKKKPSGLKEGEIYASRKVAYISRAPNFSPKLDTTGDWKSEWNDKLSLCSNWQANDWWKWRTPTSKSKQKKHYFLSSNRHFRQFLSLKTQDLLKSAHEEQNNSCINPVEKKKIN